MAKDISQHNKKYIFRIDDKKIIISKSAHDPEIQPFTKALAYFLFYKKYPTIRLEAKVDERFQPDLCAVGYDGAMLLWVECGKTSIDKIEKLFKKYRQAHFVFIKEEKDVPTFQMHLEKRFKKAISLPLVDIVVYPEHFHDWHVSEEGDVFVPEGEVTTIRWHDPQE